MKMSAKAAARLDHAGALRLRIISRHNADIFNKNLILWLARKVSPALEMVPSFCFGWADNGASPAESPAMVMGYRRARLLMEHGAGYLKPVLGAQAWGVAKVSLTQDRSLIIRSKDIHLINYLAHIFKCVEETTRGALKLERVADDALRLVNGRSAGGFSGRDLAELFFALEENFLPFPQWVVERIGRQKEFWGPTIFEQAVDSPLINGPFGRATWEIRVINQQPGSKIYQTSYAKIGASDYVGNICAGGDALKSLAAVCLAYQELFPAWTADKALEMARLFLAEAYDYARQIQEQLAFGFAAARKEFCPDYPFAAPRPLDFSTDFMGGIKGDRLVPYVIDINFYYGATGLQKTDPRAFAQMSRRSAKITQKFVRDVLALADGRPAEAASRTSGLLPPVLIA
ncbi:MAG: hypothetical protein JW782_07055 [Candidatus Saganbacteria bacterium]|nr:hypothetical protein [Candidatus Saganbacteria bacterium]